MVCDFLDVRVGGSPVFVDVPRDFLDASWLFVDEAADFFLDFFGEHSVVFRRVLFMLLYGVVVFWVQMIL